MKQCTHDGCAKPCVQGNRYCKLHTEEILRAVRAQYRDLNLRHKARRTNDRRGDHCSDLQDYMMTRADQEG